MAEDLTEYLHENGVRVRYMHSDIDTLERIEILRDLRLGAFDVLVGINLLREGLDIPECGFVAILDADKEGFLRSETSLIQTIGRAARNVDGKVILYADQITGSMERAMAETSRRREKQMAWNEANGITPESVKSRISDILESVYEKDHVRADISQFTDDAGAMVGNNLKAHLEALDKQMRNAAADLDFEKAARIRDEIKRLREMELAISDDPLAKYADMESPVSGREKGKHNKGRAVHKAVDDEPASRCSPSRIHRRHGPRHRHGDAGRRGLALAVQEEQPRRNDRPPHRNAGRGGKADQARQDRRRLLRGSRRSCAGKEAAGQVGTAGAVEPLFAPRPPRAIFRP